MQSKAWVCGCSIPGITGFEFCKGYGCLSLVSVVYSQAEGSVSD